MSTLAKLVRYHQHLVDEQRREVRELEERTAVIERAIDELDGRVVAEQYAAKSTDFGPSAYGGFLHASLLRREQLIAEFSEASRAVEDARAVLLDAFTELKRYEISLERSLLLERQQENRREQAALDEMSITRHRRKKEAGG